MVVPVYITAVYTRLHGSLPLFTVSLHYGCTFGLPAVVVDAHAHSRYIHTHILHGSAVERLYTTVAVWLLVAYRLVHARFCCPVDCAWLLGPRCARTTVARCAAVTLHTFTHTDCRARVTARFTVAAGLRTTGYGLPSLRLPTRLPGRLHTQFALGLVQLLVAPFDSAPYTLLRILPLLTRSARGLVQHYRFTVCAHYVTRCRFARPVAHFGYHTGSGSHELHHTHLVGGRVVTTHRVIYPRSYAPAVRGLVGSVRFTVVGRCCRLILQLCSTLPCVTHLRLNGTPVVADCHVCRTVRAVLVWLYTHALPTFIHWLPSCLDVAITVWFPRRFADGSAVPGHTQFTFTRLPGCTRGYGLGNHGYLRCQFTTRTTVVHPVCRSFVWLGLCPASYRITAPRTLRLPPRFHTVVAPHTRSVDSHLYVFIYWLRFGYTVEFLPIYHYQHVAGSAFATHLPAPPGWVIRLDSHC